MYALDQENTILMQIATMHEQLPNMQNVHPFPAVNNNCCLLSLLLVYFGGLYCKQY